MVVEGVAYLVILAASFKYAVSSDSLWIQTIGNWPWNLTIATGEATTFPLNMENDGRVAYASLLSVVFKIAVVLSCLQTRGGWQGSFTNDIGKRSTQLLNSRRNWANIPLFASISGVVWIQSCKTQTIAFVVK